jgi:hypothetical protein
MNPSNTPAVAPQAGEQSPSFNSTARSFGNGVARITLSGGNSTIDTHVGVIKEDAAAAPASTQSGAAVVAKSSWGATLSGSQIKGDSIVKVGGIETSVSAALAAGLIRDTGNGYAYADDAAPSASAPSQGFRLIDGRPAPTPSQEHLDILKRTGDRSHFDAHYGKGAAEHHLSAMQNGQQDQNQPAADKAPDLAPAAHTLATDYANRVGNMEVTGAVEAIIKSGAVTDHLLGQIAGQLGKDKDAVARDVATVREAFEGQARALVGQNADAIFAWAYENQPQEMQTAIRNHVNLEDARAYDQVAQAYYENLSADEILSAANAHQLSAKREGNGVVTIQTAAMPTRMSWKAACKAGYVGTVSRKR